MNLLGGYESSGDDEKTQTDNTIPKIASSSSSSSSSSSTSYPAINGNSLKQGLVAAKKRRATTFSSLPVEIQNALARGSTSQDSDSEDELSDARTASLRERKPFQNGINLIDLLPLPKAAAFDSNKGGNKSVLRPPLRLPVAREDVVRVSKRSIINGTEVGSESYNDSDEQHVGSMISAVTQEPTGGSMFSLSNSTSFGATKGIGKIFSLDHKGPFANSSLGSAYTSFENDADETVSFPGNLYRPSASSLAPFSSSRYESTESSSSSVTRDSSDATEISTEQEYGNGSIARKRKERDIEQQLISGNLDAIQSGNNGIKVVRASKDWDAHAYTTQKENEAELHRAFFAAKGGAKAIAPVSKMQGRKHQINSLVMQAAKTEMALLNAKGERNLSKQETRGKYGW